MTKKNHEKKNKSFRIRSHRYILTYPDLPKFDNVHRLFLNIIGYQLEGLNFESEIAFLSAKEKHENSMNHIHVFLEFKFRKDLYSQELLEIQFNQIYELLEENPTNSIFEVPFLKQDLNDFLPILIAYNQRRKDDPQKKQGKNGVFKGNYSGVRSKQNTLAYCLKDVNDINNSDQIYTNMHESLTMVGGHFYKTIEEHLLAVVDKQGFPAAAQTLFRIYPKEAVRRGQTILKNLQLYTSFKEDKQSWLNTNLFPLSSFRDVPLEIKYWLMGQYKEKTLVLHGPSSTGKTELGKAILFYYSQSISRDEQENSTDTRFLIATDYQDLNKFEAATTKSILYDDIDLQSLSRTQKISLLDTNNVQTHRILYRAVSIPASIPRIICTNNLEDVLTDTMYTTRRLKELERRCIIVSIDKPLFKKQTQKVKTTIKEILGKPIVNIEQYKFAKQEQSKQISSSQHDTGPLQYLTNLK